MKIENNKKATVPDSRDMFLAIGKIDEEFINLYKPRKKKKSVKWIALPLAACICILTLVAVIPPMKANAEFQIEDGVLISYNGKHENVVIPKEVNSVADYAFSKAVQITTVTLTENVSSIGSCAFYGCTNLSDIVISDDNTSFIKENDTVMSSDRKLIVKYFGNEETYTIPDSVLFLAGEAFAESNLQQIVLNQNLRFIGKNCFSGISNPPYFEKDERYTYLKDNFNHCLFLLTSTDFGELYGSNPDGTSVFEGIVTSYGWNEESGSAIIYRFGDKGEYYKVLSFHPKLTGITDGSSVSGNFWSEADGMIAIDSGVKIRYDDNLNPYIVDSDDRYYDGYMIVTDLFITHDGGMTWNNLSNHTPVHHYWTYCTSFVNERIGIVGQALRGEGNPTGWITYDGGISWQSLKVELPKNLVSDRVSSQFKSLSKQDSVYILTVEVHDNTENYEIKYISADCNNWTFYDLN